MDVPVQSALEFAAILLRAPLIPGRKEPNAITEFERRGRAFVDAYYAGVRAGLPRPICMRLERAVYDGAIGLLLAQMQASGSIDQAIERLQAATDSIRDGKSGRVATIIGMAKRLQSGHAGDDIYRAAMVCIVRLSSAPDLPAEVIGAGTGSPLVGVVEAMLQQGDAILEFFRARHGVEREIATEVMASLFANAALALVARDPAMISEATVTDECRSIVKMFNGLHDADKALNSGTAAPTDHHRPVASSNRTGTDVSNPNSSKIPPGQMVTRDAIAPARNDFQKTAPVPAAPKSNAPVAPTERRRFGTIKGFN